MDWQLLLIEQPRNLSKRMIVQQPIQHSARYQSMRYHHSQKPVR